MGSFIPSHGQGHGPAWAPERASWGRPSCRMGQAMRPHAVAIASYGVAHAAGWMTPCTCMASRIHVDGEVIEADGVGHGAGWTRPWGPLAWPIEVDGEPDRRQGPGRSTTKAGRMGGNPLAHAGRWTGPSSAMARGYVPDGLVHRAVSMSPSGTKGRGIDLEGRWATARSGTPCGSSGRSIRRRASAIGRVRGRERYEGVVRTSYARASIAGGRGARAGGARPVRRLRAGIWPRPATPHPQWYNLPRWIPSASTTSSPPAGPPPSNGPPRRSR